MSDPEIPKNPFIDTAAKTLEQVRGMRALIEGFTIPRTPRDLREGANGARVSDSFLEAAAVAMDSVAALAQAGLIASDEVRAAVAFSQAFEPVVAELETMARSLRHTIAVRRSRAGRAAKRVFQQGKSMRREPDGAVVAPHVTTMKNTLRRRRPATASAPPSAPPPAPPFLPRA